MNIDWKAVGEGAAMAWFAIQGARRWIRKFVIVIRPIIEEIERRGQDGKWDSADKKAIALKMLAVEEQNGKIKLNFFTRFFADKLIDSMAKRLPDIEVTARMQAMLDDVMKETQQ